MPRARFRRKDLKRPDEFVSRGRDVIKWAQDHLRLVAQVGGGIALVLVAVAAFMTMRSARTRQANEDLANALAEYRGGRYAQAATQLGEVAGRWAATVPGEVARIYAAQADLRANNVATATTAFQEAQAYKDLPVYLQQQVLLGQGYALERSSNPKDAADRFRDAAALEGPYISVALLAEAQLREQLGDKAAADKVYDRLLSEFSQLPEIDLIKAKRGPASS
jgi:outer membrane protein assembly factor BamD (BamD/ComL family)